MSDSRKSNTTIAVTIESVEGTYEVPSAGAEFIQVLEDGMEVTPAKDLLERNVLNSSIGRSTARTGTRSVTAALPVEFKAGSTEGAAPEYDALLRSALGSVRSNASSVSSEGVNTNTDSRIYLADGEAANFEIGDIITIQTAGAYHTSPITAKSETLGANYIDILVADPNGAIADGTSISAFTTYVTADSGHPALSISKYIENARIEKAIGCKVSNMSLNNFSTGQLADFSFALEGLSYKHELGSEPVTPSYDSSTPPVILSACVYVNGTLLDVSDISWSLENTMGFKNVTCNPNGRKSSIVTSRGVTGTFTPYKQSDNIDMYTRFDENTEFSVFASAAIPGADGEYSEVISFYMPKCIISTYTEADSDGLLQESVAFVAGRGNDGSEEEIYISYN